MSRFDLEPTPVELKSMFRIKYGDLETTGWGPRMRIGFNYFTPDDYYEAMVAKLVTEDSMWLDVGCGRRIFPSNEKLSQILARRCALLVGVDPDETLEENAFVHQRIKSSIEDFQSVLRRSIDNSPYGGTHFRSEKSSDILSETYQIRRKRSDLLGQPLVTRTSQALFRSASTTH